MAEQAAIETVNLTKVYNPWVPKRRGTALDGLSMKVPAGKVYGCLGPNGAGKTTALKILLNLVVPTGGEAFVFGRKIGHPGLRRRIGYMSENPRFYEHLSAAEFLDYSARFFRMKRKDRKRRVRELIDYVGLQKAASRKLKGFSRGMLQRIGLAQAMINDPDLLLLDEPMSGLDPIGRSEFKELIKNVCRENGKSVLICSHVLTEVEQICDMIGIISGGRLLVEDELVKLLNLERINIRLSDAGDELLEGLKKEGVCIPENDGGEMMVSAEGEQMARTVCMLAERSGGKCERVSVANETLEEFFIRVVREAAEDGEYV